MKHLAVFQGEIHIKIYKFDQFKEGFHYYFLKSDPEFYESTKFLSKKEFLRFEIDNPPIEIEEKVYIEQIDRTVKVKDRVRNATGGYIYYTDFVIEVVSIEETESSKVNAIECQRKYQENQLKLMERLKEEAEKEIITINEKKKWYRFWK